MVRPNTEVATCSPRKVDTIEHQKDMGKQLWQGSSFSHRSQRFFGPFVGQSMTSQFVVPSMAASGVDMPGFKTNTSQSWSESNASRQFRQEGTFQIGAAPVSS